MSAAVWRNAGLSYLQYLELCSRVVRYSLKEPHRALAIKRGEQGLKASKWAQGKQGEVKSIEIVAKKD